MRYRLILSGERRPRIWTLVLTALLLCVFSAGFILGVETPFGTLITVIALALALYAGVKRGGLLAAQVAIFSAVFWRAVFPPLIGYLRWDDAARYRTIRRVDVYLGPEGELIRGVEAGFQFGLLAAIFLGSLAYGAGALYRHLRRDDPSTHPWIT